MSSKKGKQHNTRAGDSAGAVQTPPVNPAPPSRAPQAMRGEGAVASPKGAELGLAALIAAVAAALFVWPLLSASGRWGINDWDQHQLYYGFVRWSLVDRGEWPLWNPFMCGGNPALANPQSFSGSPLSLLVLGFDDLLGMRLLAWLYAALGAWGAWLFARRLGCSPLSAWLPAAAFGLGSTYALHVATGHSTWFAMAWLPLALAGLHAGFTRPYAAILGGAAAALVFYGGNANLFVWLFVVAGAWAAAQAWSRRHWMPLLAYAVMSASAVGFCAAKLVPMAHFLGQVSAKDVADSSSGNLDMLWNALIDRDQTLRAHDGQSPGITWRFWEYGAYIGPLPVVGALYVTATRFRRVAPLGALVLASLWIALGHGHGAWDLLRTLPGFSGIRVPSRAIVFAPLGIATLAALLLSEWEARLPRLLVAGAVALLVFDIAWVSREPLAGALIVEPPSVARGPYQQIDGRKDFRGGWDPVAKRYVAPYSNMYPTFLEGRGTVNCYDRLHLPVFAVPARRQNGAVDGRWRGEAWLESGGTAELAEVGGQRLAVKVQPAAPGRLILNENWAPGWTTADGRPVQNDQGRLGADVVPSDRRVVFQYAPPGLGLGLTITLATILSCLAMPVLRRRRRVPTLGPH